MFLGIPIGYAKKLTKSEAPEECNRMYIELKCAAEKNKKARAALAANQEQLLDREDGEHDDEMEDIH
jgi:hypothetical protein